MKESFSTEHSCELLADTFEQFLDGSRVTNEGSRHLQTSRWNVADSCLHVIRNPFNEVRAVLVLHVQHLLINFFHGHSTTEHGSHSEVATVTWITSSHHVLSIEHLLCQFWHSQCSVLLGATAGQWSKSRHEEMETWEWDHVDSEFTKISIKLTRESETCCYTAHCRRNQMIQVTVGGSR